MIQAKGDAPATSLAGLPEELRVIHAACQRIRSRVSGIDVVRELLKVVW